MVGEVFAELGSDPLPRPPVLVEDFAHAPLPPPEKPIIVPCRQGCRILPCFPADRSAPKSTLASAFRVRTVDVHAIFASLMVVSQLKRGPPTREPLLMYPMSWSRTPKFHTLGIHA